MIRKQEQRCNTLFCKVKTSSLLSNHYWKDARLAVISSSASFQNVDATLCNEFLPESWRSSLDHWAPVGFTTVWESHRLDSCGILLHEVFLEGKPAACCCTQGHGLMGKWWWWVDGWTGWPWSSFPVLVILWFYTGLGLQPSSGGKQQE